MTLNKIIEKFTNNESLYYENGNYFLTQRHGLTEIRHSRRDRPTLKPLQCPFAVKKQARKSSIGRC